MTTLVHHEITPLELYEKLKHVRIGGDVCYYTEARCAEIAPLINEINALKQEKNAVILAHSYVSPDIIFGVADYSGDSYGLSLDAQKTKASTIVFSAVKFMGETAKLLNPEKEVLIPAELNGCSLADSISGQKVRELKEKYPNHAFICYINTTADVKAECDVCVTSSNVYDIVERYPNKDIVFLPDKLMGLNIIEELKRRGVDKNIVIYDGVCYVHETYDPEMIEYLRLEYPDLKVLSHPECSPGVLHESDYVGSTSQMLKYVQNSEAKNFFMLTECGLTSRLQVEARDKNFVGSCTQCKYMKANTLENILSCLKNPQPYQQIKIESQIQDRARQCIEAMFKWAKG